MIVTLTACTQVIVIDILPYYWHVYILRLISVCYLTKLFTGIWCALTISLKPSLFECPKVVSPQKYMHIWYCVWFYYLIIVWLTNLTINIYWITTMAMSALPCLRMDWSASDRAQTFKEFRQISRMWFKVKGVKVEDQHNYIILCSGSIGLRMFNTRGLTDEQLKDPKNIWEKFSEKIEPPENVRIHSMEFQRFRQHDDEYVNDFFTHCKSKVMKCKFQTEAEQEERLREVLISGVKYAEVQKELLGKDDKLKLTEALDIALTHDATSSYMTQFKSIDSKGRIKTTIQQQKFKQFGNCGGHHAFTLHLNCPASKDDCHNCGHTGHWQSMCHRGNKQPAQQRQRPRSRSRNRPNRWNQYGHRQSRDRGQAGNWRRNHNVHSIKNQDSDDPDLVDDFENLTFDPIDVIQCDSVGESRDHLDEVFVFLRIRVTGRPGEHALKAKVDTGAQGNILPLGTFQWMFPALLDTDKTSRNHSRQQHQTDSIQWLGHQALWQNKLAMQV